MSKKTAFSATLVLAVAVGWPALLVAQTPSVTTPAEKDAGGVAAQAYWELHARNGVLSIDQALGYTGPEGEKVDVEKLDANRDGSISAQEWTDYHLARTGAAAAGRQAPSAQ